MGWKEFGSKSSFIYVRGEVVGGPNLSRGSNVGSTLNCIKFFEIQAGA